MKLSIHYPSGNAKITSKQMEFVTVTVAGQLLGLADKPSA